MRSLSPSREDLERVYNHVHSLGMRSIYQCKPTSVSRLTHSFVIRQARLDVQIPSPSSPSTFPFSTYASPSPQFSSRQLAFPCQAGFDSDITPIRQQHGAIPGQRVSNISRLGLAPASPPLTLQRWSAVVEMSSNAQFGPVHPIVGHSLHHSISVSFP